MTHISQTPDSDTPNESVHHHILPPDKLLQAWEAYDADLMASGGYTQKHARRDFNEALQQMAADALVAELERLLENWKKVKLDTRYDVGKTAGMVHARIAQLKATTVPDLSSEHETLRELGKEDE